MYIEEKKKESILVYGFGQRCKNHLKRLEKKYNILAIVDSDHQKAGTSYENYFIILPSEISQYNYEKIIITPREYGSILMILEAIGVDNDKIRVCLTDEEMGHFWKNVEVTPLYSGGVRCQFDNIDFKIARNSDFMVYHDVILKNNWNFKLNGDCVVIDIGMNIGLATLYFANLKNVKKVYGYEPFRQTFEQAKKNILLNSLTIQHKIEVFPCGLSNEEKVIQTMYNPEYTTNMRTDCGYRWHGSNEVKDTVKVLDANRELKRIIAENPKTKMVMKVDCEGEEYNIFKCLEANVLKHIDVILCETHDGRENELKTILDDQGFWYFDNYIGNKLGFIYAVNMNKNSKEGIEGK